MRTMQMPALGQSLRRCAIVAAVLTAVCNGAFAQSLGGNDLVAALQKGGYVLIMRHATSPQVLPDASIAAPGNTRLERQLNENGHKTARAMGEALKTLRIPIGPVLSSPTFRTLETVRDLQVGMPDTFNLLGDRSPGYEFSSFEDGARFMRVRTAEVPPAGTNTLIVTHLPNVQAAFGAVTAGGFEEGETIVFRPDGTTATQVGRIKIEAWTRFAAPP
jgi:phosphohistidine phosphatase SixA